MLFMSTPIDNFQLLTKKLFYVIYWKTKALKFWQLVCLPTEQHQINKEPMEHLKFLIKINNIVGYILIATIVLSPIGFIQVLLGYLVMLVMEEKNNRRIKKRSWNEQTLL